MSWINQFEECTPRICVGDYGLSADLVAVREDYSGCGAILNANLLHVSIGSYLSSGIARGDLHCVGDRANTADGKIRRASGMCVSGGANQQDQTGTGRPGAHRGAEYSASGDRGAKQFGFKELGGEIGNGHRSPAEQPVHILLAKFAQAASSLQHSPQVGAAGIVNVWRRQFKRVSDDAADLFERLL